MVDIHAVHMECGLSVQCDRAFGSTAMTLLVPCGHKDLELLRAVWYSRTVSHQ